MSIFCNLNESQHPLPLHVKQTIISCCDHARHYVEWPQYNDNENLKSLISSRFKVTKDNIILGAGCNGVLQASIIYLASKGYKNLVSFVPNYESVFQYASNVGITSHEIPITISQNNNFNLDSIIERVQSIRSETVIVYFSNPHNPTGLFNTHNQLKQCFDQCNKIKNCFWIFDEAYGEFFDNDNSMIDLINQSNVIVLKTFSKYYQLAGLRTGYAIASPNIIDQMTNFILVDSLNILGIKAAIAALESQSYYKQIYDDTKWCRETLYNALIQMGIPSFPSQCNFVLCKLNDNHISALQKANIVISRDFKLFNQVWKRISVGNQQITIDIINALKAAK